MSQLLESCRLFVAVGTKTKMANESDQPRDLDLQQAQLAYSIIENLVEHTRIVSDLIALMAQVLDEDTTKALTQTPTWTAYLDSRRSMEKTKQDIKNVADILNRLNP